MPMRASVNQQFQIGAEAIPGTSVPASKLIEAFDVVWGIKPDIKTYRPTGRKLISIAEEMTEMTEGKLSGELDYNAILYPVAGVFGKITPALHGPSTTAYDWTITPPLTGNANPQTFTGQKGDASFAEAASYMLMSDWGYKVSRKEATNDASFIAQLMNVAATLTAAPTVVPLQPAKGAHINLFLDSTSAGIGTTQITNPMEFSFAASGYYAPFWAVNRANPSFGSHVDQAPKNEFKLSLPFDTQGRGYVATMQAGSKVYARVDAVGPVLDATNSLNYGFRHDMCLVITNIGQLSDKDGIYAVELTFEVAEDPNWSTGKGHTLSGTCALPAL